MGAGFEVVAAFDHWAPAVKVYRHNFSHPMIDGDLQDTAVQAQIKPYRPEMIIGGPPCQDFSSAGKRDESLGRADLTLTFAQIVADVRPPWFVMENVERIKSSAVLRAAKAIFANAGYGLSEAVLNASLCGVPQHRKRYFLVGELGGQDRALLVYVERDLAPTPMTIFDYLGHDLGIEYYYRHPHSYQRRGIFSIYEPSPTIRGVNRPIPSNYQLHENDAAPLSDALRPLTTHERSLLQTFPPDFTFVGTKTDVEQLIGNAVPVKQAEYVARAIRAYLHDKSLNRVVPEPTQLQLF